MLSRCLKVLAAAFLAYLIFLLLGTIVPFLFHPRIRRKTQESFRKTAFYGSDSSGERAALLSENGEALAERVRLISLARERVILSTFEFRSDTAGRQVLAALLAAAERGCSGSDPGGRRPGPAAYVEKSLFSCTLQSGEGPNPPV